MSDPAAQRDFEFATARLQAGDALAALRIYARLLCQVGSDGLLLHLIGVSLHQLGQSHEALRWYGRTAGLLGRDPMLLHNVGEAAWAVGDAARATDAYREALAARPDLVESRVSLSMLQRESAMPDAARRDACIALALAPDHARAHLAHGLAGENAPDFRRAVALDPAYAGGWVNLGAMLLRDMALGAAARACRRALVLVPATGEAWVNLGSVELGLARPAMAIRFERRGLALRTTPSLHSNVLFAMLSDPDSGDLAQLTEARRWHRAHAVAAPDAAHTSNADPDRPLVVGYLSADFRRHPVAGNVVELLERHDRSRFKVHCYAEVFRTDDMTERFRRLADRWLPTGGMSDADIAAAIRRDRVDVLVLLGGHTASNRLAVAAWKAAPVQASFHAPGTTGLPEIDWWLSDAALTPPGWENRFAEGVLRLPTFYTFQTPMVEPAPGPERAYPVLGSFNNPGKLNDLVFSTWTRVLQRLPTARLHLGYHAYFEEPALQRRVRKAMRDVADRIDFVPRVTDAAAHYARLASVDLVLDTFPFGGATSTFEALWAGTPVMALAGDRFVGRVGMAICRALGLDDFIATDPDEYVERAARLADDRQALRRLGATLRDRLRGSAMMDYPRQTRALEDAYRTMWRRYSARR